MAEYTKFYVDYALDNNDAQTDATISATEYKAGSQLSDLPFGTNYVKSISKEHNYTVLDGSYSDEPVGIAFMSDDKSTSAGTFLINPTITTTFTQQHTSFILTLQFVEDAPTEIEVSWYLGSALIYSLTETTSGNETTIEIQKAIEAYNKVVIVFKKALPNRYIKLNRIEFGTTMHWDETIVKSATLVKGLNRISAMLSIDTLTFDLVDTSYSMNFANPKGIHTLFKRDQAMYPVEVLDGKTVPLGKFFLNTFTTKGNIGTISAYSYMGILDRIPFTTGTMYNGVAAGTVLASIFTAAGIDSSEYQIDNVTSAQLLYGTIKPTTCRDALRQVLFACNSIINTSDAQKIIISKFSSNVKNDIVRANKSSTNVSSIEYVSGVKLSYTTYQLSGNTTEIAKEVYAQGTHTVQFNAPYANISVTNGTLISSTTYSVTFTADGTSEVTISGYTYEATVKFIDLEKETHYGQVRNIKEYNTTLCNSETAKTLANTLLAYHSSTLQLQIQHYADDIDMDYSRFIENPVAELDGFVAMFESRTIDLTGGFFDSAKLIGKYDVSDRFYFAGKDHTYETGKESIVDIYAGEDIGTV